MSKEYATVAIGRVQLDVYKLPSGDQVRCHPGGTTELSMWWIENQKPLEDARSAERREWERAVEAQLAGVTIRLVQRIAANRYSTEEFDQVTFSDGTTLKAPVGKGHESARKHVEARLTTPERPVEFDAWRRKLRKDILRTWQAHLFVRGTTSPLAFDEEKYGWSYGYPITFAQEQLNTMAASGWSVVHVSEDHGLYKGTDASDEAYPARVRYLLVREVPEDA